MHNGWQIIWAILLKTEKRKATGHDTSSKKRYRENLMKIGPKSESGLDMTMRNS